MAASHAQAQKLSEAVYRKAREAVLRTTASAIERLDKIGADDAAKLKRELRSILRAGGFTARRIGRVVDEVFTASRSRRIAVVEAAMRSAARTAVGADSAMFREIFGDEEDEIGEIEGEGADPLALGRSSSLQNGTPSLRLVRGSEAR